MFPAHSNILEGSSLTNWQQFFSQLFVEKRALEQVGVSILAKLFETVGLSVFLTWWGTRTNPFEQ